VDPVISDLGLPLGEGDRAGADLGLELRLEFVLGARAGEDVPLVVEFGSVRASSGC
jgi:hypothetical protein